MMNRRELLKQLGVGGAVVIASPVIVPTFQVAHAASPAGTGIVGAPEPGAPLPYAPASFPNARFKNKQVSIVPDQSSVACADQSLPIITYEWRIVSADWQKRKAAYLRITEASTNGNDLAGAQVIAMPASTSGFSGPTAYSAPSYASSFLIRKAGSQGDVKIDQRDEYVVEARVRWHCDGATSDLEAEYTFAGIGVNAPSVTNTSYAVVPA